MSLAFRHLAALLPSFLVSTVVAGMLRAPDHNDPNRPRAGIVPFGNRQRESHPVIAHPNPPNGHHLTHGRRPSKTNDKGNNAIGYQKPPADRRMPKTPSKDDLGDGAEPITTSTRSTHGTSGVHNVSTTETVPPFGEAIAKNEGRTSTSRRISTASEGPTSASATSTTDKVGLNNLNPESTSASSRGTGHKDTQYGTVYHALTVVAVMLLCAQ